MPDDENLQILLEDKYEEIEVLYDRVIKYYFTFHTTTLIKKSIKYSIFYLIYVI